jgi:hypothetical protein
MKRKGKIKTQEEFKQLKTKRKKPQSLVEFFAQSPLANANLDLERTPDYGRTIDLFSSQHDVRSKAE